MAKRNDMPELISAKVFLTNLFTKEYLKPRCRHPLTAIRHHARQTPQQRALQAVKLSCQQAHYRKKATLPLTAPGSANPAAVLSGHSDMNGFTVDVFNRNSDYLKDELIAIANNVHQYRP